MHKGNTFRHCKVQHQLANQVKAKKKKTQQNTHNNSSFHEKKYRSQTACIAQNVESNNRKEFAKCTWSNKNCRHILDNISQCYSLDKISNHSITTGIQKWTGNVYMCLLFVDIEYMHNYQFIGKWWNIYVTGMNSLLHETGFFSTGWFIFNFIETATSSPTPVVVPT